MDWNIDSCPRVRSGSRSGRPASPRWIEIDCDYLVASGSLPRGVPTGFYVQVADIAASKSAKFILDTSGEALRKATGRGLHLIKPSLGELEELIGRELPEAADQEQAVRALIDGGAAEMVALTLGRDGALLGTRARFCRLHGVKVRKHGARSAPAIASSRG